MWVPLVRTHTHKIGKSYGSNLDARTKGCTHTHKIMEKQWFKFHRSRDEGIDGIIKEDRLGLDTIYIQAKRWEGTVGRPEIHKFVGALQGQRAKKGIFITTSSLSDDTKEYASRIDTKVVLIDGEKLAELMVDNDVGVSRLANYEIKKVDSDYFAEE